MGFAIEICMYGCYFTNNARAILTIYVNFTPGGTPVFKQNEKSQSTVHFYYFFGAPTWHALMIFIDVVIFMAVRAIIIIIIIIIISLEVLR